MVDIVLLRLVVRSGWPQRVMELLIRVFALEQFLMQEGGGIGDAFRSWMNARLEPILADEGMYTESVFLSREHGEICLFWYMEAEDIGAVYEAFEVSNHSLTNGRIAGWFFDDPEKILTTEVESDYRLLLHAWNPDRP